MAKDATITFDSPAEEVTQLEIVDSIPGLVAMLINFFGTIDAEAILELGREGAVERAARRRAVHA